MGRPRWREATARLIVRALPLLFLLVLAQPAHGQANRAEAEARLEALKQQILEAQQQLERAQETEEASMQRLESVQRQIRMRQQLIEEYRRRVRGAQMRRDSLQESMGEIEESVQELQMQYQDRARHAYKYGRMHDLALILAARSINEMLVRVQYLDRFTDRRRDQLSELRAAVDTMQVQRERLKETQERTQQLIASAEAERTELVQLQRNRRQMIETLQNRRTELESTITQKQEAISKLEQRVQELIASAETRERTNPALTGSFRSNRGALPWPVQGVITEPFGEITNPVYGTKTLNPGVLISANSGSEVRSVFSGTVIGIDTMPEFGTYVVLSHGSYQTLYGNLSMVYVSPGQELSAGETIARAGTESAPKGAGVFFGVFESGREQNPARWLRQQ